MQLAAPVAWKVGVVGVAIAGAVTYFAATRVTPSVVPELDLVDELEPQPGDGIERGVLAADRGAIARVGYVLAKPEAIDAVLVDQSRTEDLGYGVSRRELSMYSGDGGCSVTLLYIEGVVARADASCWYEREAWDRVGRFLMRSLAAAQLTIDADVHVVRATASVRYAAGAKRLRSKLDYALGPLTQIRGTAEVLAAYDTLTGPAKIEFGYTCGITGAETQGEIARRTLIQAGRVDLLRNALRGPNPEGRAFAWEGLRFLGKVRNADRVVMWKLAHLPLQLRSCGGCMMFEQSSSAVFVER